MSNERKGVEFFVGLFLLIGFGVIAAMIVTFGRLGGRMEERYPIRVRFPNASGLVKGSGVLLSGAQIGVVAQAPQLTGGNYEVEVGLLIRSTVKIPRTSAFQIRSSGMLGDSYVDVLPPREFTPADFAEPNELITGLRTGGLDELTSKGSQMMDTINSDVLKKVSTALDEIKSATTEIKTTTTSLKVGLLSERNLKNLEETFANLKTTTADFSKTSKDLDVMVNRAQEVVDAAKGTMKTVDGAAGELKLTLSDFRKTSDSARSLLNKAANGEGALGTLISDKQTGEDLKALISNMRRSGVLWYKNRPPAAPESTPAPPRRR